MLAPIQDLITGKYKTWVGTTIAESLGESVPELVDFMVETLREHKSAAEMIEGLEPVLSDEASEFVAKLWRIVVVDSLINAAGLRV